MIPCTRCGHPNSGQAHLCDPDSKLVYIDAEGNDHEVPDQIEFANLVKETEELKTELGFMQLKEKLQLRLVASGNDELAKRGAKIDELEEFVSRDYMSMVDHHKKLTTANERIAELEDLVAYWAKEARGGFGED